MAILKHARDRILIVLGLGVTAVMLTLTLQPSLNAQTDSDCGDPFNGEQVRFDTGYWPQTDFCQHTVPYNEIISGGPPPDGIPPIDNPTFESIADAQAWLQPQSPVIAFELDGEARAYPLSILTRHEIVNDVFGDTPVAVTFCPLCNSAVVFDRRIDGETLRLGVSGNLRNSDLIMWDDKTQSWWQQFTGEGIVGEYAGAQLELLPSLVVSFDAFAQQYADGVVLSPASRGYGTNPYVGYDSNASPFLFTGELDDRLFAVERVLGVFSGSEAVAYPFPVLETEGVINDTVNEQPVVAFWQPGAVSALDQRDIDASRDVGMAALYSRELNGETLTFVLDDTDLIRDEQTNTVWNVFGTGQEGELAGEQLQQRLAFPHFWFAWAAFRPETRIYGVE
jgi:hypothetical protein